MDYDDDKAFIRRVNDRRIREKILQTLAGLLKGIIADRMVNDNEAAELKGWVDRYREDLSKWHLEAMANQIDIWLHDGKIDAEELEDVRWLAEHLSDWGTSDDLIHCAIQELHGVFHGVLADRELADDEIRGLQNWIYDNLYLKGSYPYDELESLVTAILADGKVSEDERNLMRSFMGDFIDFSTSTNLTRERYLELRKKYTISGICATDPEIEFSGKTFCLTGEFEHGRRSEMSNLILKNGGDVCNGITYKTDYLVVGGKGNECWAFVGYGRKIEKAIERRKEGQLITIICEADFWDAVQ